MFSISIRKLRPSGCSAIILTSRYPVGISTEFCFRWQKKSSRWEGEGDKGGKGGKKLGEKLKEKKERKKKQQQHGELNSHRASISLKTPMPYPSPTVTLKLHCEQFLTFIVMVTFDLLHTLLRMRAYEQTDKDNYI